MSYSSEFLAQYQKGYGQTYALRKPDYSRCAKEVNTTPNERFSSFSQCSRKNGHGPHGAWCKQHDPEAVKARRDAQEKKWKANWAAESRKLNFKRGCQDAIRQIAAGHNDPRGLAQSLIDALEGKTECP
jgi:hypothetical protein